MSATLLEFVYGGVSSLLEVLIPSLLERRARRGKEDRARLGERMGHASEPRPPGPLVWLHGVSVGETTSLLPLVEALRRRRPGLNLLVTSGTVTSAELLARRLPPGVRHQFAPVDTPRAVRRFLDHWRPDAGLFAESELWPNLIRAARKRGVRLALVSARMTEASARRWGRLPGTARDLLSAFDAVLPQDQATADRLAALGARVGPRLNLKLAGDPLPCDEAELGRLRAAVAGRKVALAASTHPGEEALIAGATPAGALTILAPRHPDRGAELAASFRAPRRAAGDAPTAARVYVADTLGELGLFFRLADVVVMGGGFAAGVGGHNPLEPARLGKAIVTGSDVFNAAEVYAEMFAAGAAVKAADGAALGDILGRLLANAAERRAMGEAALAYAEAQSAALDRALALLDPLLPA